MKKIFVFRHGETDWNRIDRFQGHTDIPLNETGRTQARRLAEQLAPEGLQAILSSDLSRARETGKIVADACQIPIHTDFELREANIGEGEGLTRLEMEEKFGIEFMRRWRSHLAEDADIAFPRGETGAQISVRAFGAIERFLAENPKLHTIGVSTHGGVIRRLLQFIVRPEWGVVPIPNGIVYLITYHKPEIDHRTGKRKLRWRFEPQVPLRALEGE